MRTRRGILRLLMFAMVAVGLASASIAADEHGFKVIVNPDMPVDAADRDFLRDAYLKKATVWSNGETVHPIDLASRFAARDGFTARVIRKTPSQIRTYWNQQIFSGKGVPPPEADSIADALAYVLATKGAVAYIPAEADPGRAKVIWIK